MGSLLILTYVIGGVKVTRQFLAGMLAATVVVGCDVEDVGDGDGGDASGKADGASDQGFCAQWSSKPPTRYKKLPIEGAEGYVAKSLACSTEGDEPEAYLQAMAVVMRSIAVYQDPTCGRECNDWKCTPNAAQIEATLATEGEFLWYGAYPIFGFHSSGRETINAQCEVEGQIRNRTTPDNACKFGDDVTRSGLAWKPQYDRGSLHHEVAQCLADMQELDHVDLLRQFYGEDIGIGCETSPEARVCEDGQVVDPVDDIPDDDIPDDDIPDDDIPDDDIPDDDLTCSEGNGTRAAAKLLGEDFREGIFSAWSFEDLMLPAGGEAWFVYTGIDEFPRGNALPYVWVEAPGAKLEVCQYFTCRDSEAIEVTCAEGDRSDTLSDGTPGCCHEGEGELEFYFDDVSCPAAASGDESGTVEISVSQEGGACIEAMQMQVDFG